LQFLRFFLDIKVQIQIYQSYSDSCPRTSSGHIGLWRMSSKESSLVPAVVPVPLHGYNGLETLGSGSEESSLVPAVVPVPLHGYNGLETLGSEESSLVPAVVPVPLHGQVGLETLGRKNQVLFLQLSPYLFMDKSA
jgi:hypothetical protein